MTDWVIFSKVRLVRSITLHTTLNHKCRKLCSNMGLGRMVNGVWVWDECKLYDTDSLTLWNVETYIGLNNYSKSK